MSRKVMSLLAATALSALLLSCGKEEVSVEYVHTSYEKSDFPETISFNGGTFKFSFKADTVKLTRASEPIYLAWKYRVNVGEATGEPVEITSKTDAVEISVPANYTENSRTITVEAAFTPAPENYDEEPSSDVVWKEVASATQDAALVLIEDFYWAKGNITLKDGKFAIAENMSDAGLYFKKGSSYGVNSEPDTYDGLAYTPSRVKIDLAAIPENDPADDPCAKVDPGLRLPTYEEAYYLYYQEDLDKEHSQNGVKGMGFKNCDFFLPFAGTMSKTDGTISMKNSYGAYWLDGESYEGDRSIYVISDEYSMIYYDLSNTNLASVRCVKNIKQPSLVSYSPKTLDSYKEFNLEVVTNPGEFALYKVELLSDIGDVSEISCTPKVTTVTFKNMEANTSKKDKTWKIFINGKYTGESFVQPAITNYAFYAGHSPAKHDHTAFDLTVNVDTDLSDVPVEVKSNDGLSMTESASKSDPVVYFSIPENTSNTDERVLSIYVNGENTGKTVVQAAAPNPNGFSVIWSPGYLTVKDGAYAFAGPKEVGMFFKWKSRYGIDLGEKISSSSKYPGKAYGPEETTIKYDDIQPNEVDPCSLVLPAGTWRLPTEEEFLNLTKGGSKEWEDGVYRMCSDGDQNVYLAASGQLSAAKSGSSVFMAGRIFAWTSTPGTQAGKYKYLFWFFSSETSEAKVNASGVDSNQGLQVRCVRDK